MIHIKHIVTILLAIDQMQFSFLQNLENHFVDVDNYLGDFENYFVDFENYFADFENYSVDFENCYDTDLAHCYESHHIFFWISNHFPGYPHLLF